MSSTIEDIARRLKSVIEVEDKVVLTKDREGIVKYKGPLADKNGIFYGIALTKGTGKHSGIYKGKTRHFTCKKNRGIFVDKRQILRKKDPNLERRRSSVIAPKLTDMFHAEYLRPKYGRISSRKIIDPIGILSESNWFSDARSASNHKEIWQSLKRFMFVLCGDELAKDHDEIPNKIAWNSDYESFIVLLSKWLQNCDHLNSRKHILKILVPFCKTYPLTKSVSKQLASNLIQRQWKETKFGFRALVTSALCSVYYATECQEEEEEEEGLELLDEWKSMLIPVMKSRSDVGIQIWHFLAQICILGAATKSTKKKERARWDIESLLSDQAIIGILEGTMAMSSGKNDRVMASCAEFIFGANYILPDLKTIHSVYRDIKRNHELMNDAAMNAFCQVLVKGDNAFDRGQPAMEGVFGCDYCTESRVQMERVRQCVDRRRKEMNGLKKMVHSLKESQVELEGNVVAMRSESERMERRKEVVVEEMEDIGVGIKRVNREIERIERKEMMRKRIEERNGVSTVDERLWTRWNCGDVMEWILCLENGRFEKYLEQIMDRMMTENVRGSELSMIDEQDLMHFGIDDEDDRKDVMRYIGSLVADDSQIENTY